MIPHHTVSHPVTRWLAVACLGALCSLALLSRAVAAPLSVAAGGGIDYFSAPGQVTRSAIAIGALGAGPVHVSVVGGRYDDSVVGRGFQGAVNLGLPLAPATRLRLVTARSIGDGSFRAWRIRGGPELSLPLGGTIGLFYARYQQTSANHSDAGLAELEIPVRTLMTARGQLSYASAGDAPRSATGTAGLGWTVLRDLEVTADAGVARNGALATAPVAGAHGLLPHTLLGGGGAHPGATPPASWGGTFELGAHLLFP